MKILVGGISTKFASCPSRNSVKCALTKGKKARAKRVGRVGHPQIRVFKRFQRREATQETCKGECEAEAAPRQGSSCLL